MKRLWAGVTVAALGLALVPAAGASPADNSIQPGHVYFGKVAVGTHPSKTLVFHNGTGATEAISKFAISGSGGYVFALGASTCKVGTVLAPRETCTIQVHVKTKTKLGWFRSVLAVTTTARAGRSYHSAELRAHIV